MTDGTVLLGYLRQVLLAGQSVVSSLPVEHRGVDIAGVDGINPDVISGLTAMNRRCLGNVPYRTLSGIIGEKERLVDMDLSR